MSEESSTPEIPAGNFMQADTVQESMSAVFDKMQEEEPSNTTETDNETETEDDSADDSTPKEDTQSQHQSEESEPQETEAKTEDAPSEESGDNAGQPTDKIPVGLSEEVKSNWDELPDYVKTDIVKRERDAQKNFEKNSEFVKHSKAIRNLEAPYQAMMQALGANPITAYKDHLNTAYILNNGSQAQKTALIQTAIDTYGIELASNKSSGEDWDFDEPSTDPRMEQLMNQVNALTNELNGQKNSVEVAQQSNADKVISDFRTDPAHKYFDEVNPLMQAMIGSGQAKNLDEAYEMATMAHPKVRTSVLAEKGSKNKKAKLEEAKNKSNKAKNAAGTNLKSKGGNVILTQKRESVRRGAMPDFSKTMANTYDSLSED